jgi:FlaA1/EpsC-like NDP-sugar epimerase
VCSSDLSPEQGLDATAVERKIVGIRPGEKMYELLMTEDESSIALEVDEMFIIPPHIEIPHRGLMRRTYEGAEPAPTAGYDSRRDLPLGRRSILQMLQEVFPERDRRQIPHRAALIA